MHGCSILWGGLVALNEYLIRLSNEEHAEIDHILGTVVEWCRGNESLRRPRSETTDVCSIIGNGGIGVRGNTGTMQRPAGWQEATTPCGRWQTGTVRPNGNPLQHQPCVVCSVCTFPAFVA